MCIIFKAEFWNKKKIIVFLNKIIRELRIHALPSLTKCGGHEQENC